MEMSISQQERRFFEGKIMDFYRKAGREHLPWRREGITAYEVWVSEVMLQQTQVSRVIGYYENFLRRFPTVQDLAQASWEEFLPYYAGLGYYRRGRNMLETAKRVVIEHGGEFPRDKKMLMQLPGVGDYTASARLSFAYGENHLAWDTNLKRVIGRFFFGNRQAFEGVGVSKQGVFDQTFKTKAREWNAALMDFGSAICLGRPHCAACPLRERCVYAREAGAQEAVPQKGREKTAQGAWKSARVMLWLHEEHRLYYSSEAKTFQPFVLPPEYNTRAGIKDYFREHYGLELAVRPPHRRLVMLEGPTLWVNAQILSGTPSFTVFAPQIVRDYTESVLK
jgi:A/G-specific adenine glycosylase